MKTPAGWAIEFQHSYIDPKIASFSERLLRQAHLGIDATKTAQRRSATLEELVGRHTSSRLAGVLSVRRVWSEGCTRADGHAPTFFDFGDSDSLWWLLKLAVIIGHVAKFSSMHSS